MARVVPMVCHAREKTERPKGMKLLAPKETLQRKLAKFKAAVRNVMVFCCDSQDECLVKACQSRQNRLLNLAISNKHACIQGLPHINDEDAKAIAAEISYLKGITSKK